MTGMLASVNSTEEARMIAFSAVDIIDLKSPEQGALGALPIETVKTIVEQLKGLKPISATIGDLPMQAEVVFDAAQNMAATNADYIKIGFFPGGNWPETIDKLSQLCAQGYKLIAVLFADTQTDLKLIKVLQQAGFYGVMLDTMDKQKGALTDLMSTSEIEAFVQQVKSAGLICGLAGSLKQSQIKGLLSLKADYLGFRGALCPQHQRTDSIDMDAVKALLAYFYTAD